MEKISQRRLETRVVEDSERLAVQKENLADESIDYFDVEKLKADFASYNQEKERIDRAPFWRNLIQDKRTRTLANEDRLSAIFYSYKEFSELSDYTDEELLHPHVTKFLWQTILNSQNPYIIKLKSEHKENFFEVAFLNLLKSETLPIEVWLEILQDYKNLLSESDRKIGEMAPKIHEQVADDFIERINPDLETKLTREQILQKLQDSLLKIKDPLIYKNSGTHTPVTKVTRVNLNQDILNGIITPENYHTIAHENLHCLSTGQILEYRFPGFDDDNNPKTIVQRDAQWIGLNVRAVLDSKFNWLNEALTEILASQLSNFPPNSYQSERELLDLILKNGRKQIDIKILYNAYFEKKGKEATKGEDGHKFWKKFRAEIREAYDHDPQFLIRLDDLIREKGLGAATAILKDWDPENPVIIETRSTKDEKALAEVRAKLNS